MNQNQEYRISFFSLAILFMWVVLIAGFLFIPRIVGIWRHARSITIFAPPLMVDPVLVQRFEHETGIKVYVTYFENHSALISKMEASGGHGYDLIFGDDHALEILRQANLLQKVDVSKLPFAKDIHPLFLNHPYYDPQGLYTIPYCMMVYGLVYDTQFFAKHGLSIPDSYQSIFYPPAILQGRICMTDEPREAFMLGAQYLYGSPNALQDKVTQHEVKNLLKKQRAFVNVYSLDRADHVISMESCVLAAMVSSDFWRLKAVHPQIDFVLPREGGFMQVEALALPRETRKQGMIYQFVNFLFKHDVIMAHAQQFGYIPSRIMDKTSYYPMYMIGDISKLSFFRSNVSDAFFNAEWVDILSR